MAAGVETSQSGIAENGTDLQRDDEKSKAVLTYIRTIITQFRALSWTAKQTPYVRT